MIGVNIIYGKNKIGKITDSLPPFSKIKYWNHPSSFFVDNNFIHSNIILPYKDYPIRESSIGGMKLLLEGKVYNFEYESIINHIQLCYSNGVFNTKAYQQYVSSYSGEFIIYVSTQSSIFVFTDCLGRLPVYIYQTSDFLFIGRSLYLLKEQFDVELNPMSVLEYLWCSYPLNFKTLYKNVYRLKGGTIIELSSQAYNYTIEEGKVLNFDERIHDDINSSTEKLTHLFNQACNRITNQKENLPINISLSGGQDSRVVAYSCAQNTKNIFATSFEYMGANADVKLAKEIAALCNINWKSIPVNDSKDLQNELLLAKMGQNYLGMSFILDFYKKIVQDNTAGSLYVTGDGGDKALPYLGETKSNISFEQLVINIANRHTSIPYPIVCKILNISETDFLHHISTILKSYPEQSSNNKSIHFTIYERAHQSFHEGEDRSRSYFWATTPFYDLDFFKYAMAMQDKYKKHYKLYRKFMNEISIPLANIPDASGHSINHPFFQIRKGVQEYFRSTKPTIKNTIRNLGGLKKQVGAVNNTEINETINLLKLNSKTNSIFNMNVLSDFLKIANRDQFNYVLTISKLAEII